MKLEDLKKEIEKYQYFEDTTIIDVSLAAILATRLKIGDPVWMIIIGPSSGGKSQILRPLSLTDPKFLHRVDDLTENTFLSGMKLGKNKTSGEKKEPSLLHRIGNHGMIVVSDLTVLFSKAAESRAAILSQFRMIYDGEMTKHSGSSDEGNSWKGYLGVLAGSTPSIYAHFEEVSDMGERFIYYRMKDYDAQKATKISMNRKLYGKELDEKLSELYADYIKEVVLSNKDAQFDLPEDIQDRILQIASFAEKVRTTAHVDFRERTIDRIPTPAMPMRVALQLTSIAKALMAIKKHETGEVVLSENDLKAIDWLGFSLGNEEKRAVLNILGSVAYGTYMRTTTIADSMGLYTRVVGNILQNLCSVGVVVRSGDGDSLTWRVNKESDWRLIRRVAGIDEIKEVEEREANDEDGDEKSEAIEMDFEKKW